MMIFIEDGFASFLTSKLHFFAEVVGGSLELIDGVTVTHIVRW